ncbi:MAG: DUF2490 domain-containing protein, partial [Raineya sp.]|nr:DUF2490 domain-containing protein [Raineya sp.]
MFYQARFLLFFLTFFITNILFAQGGRINEYNTIGWYNYFGTFGLSKTWSIHTEYQWRRVDWVTAWQQSLLR